MKMLAKASISLILLAFTGIIVVWTFDAGSVLAAVRNLSITTLATVLAVLLVNALAAALRFRIIAADVGHSISFRHAIAAVSAGSLGGAVFFQLAGQLMTRGAMMKQAGIPFASVVVMTLYERAIAAIVSSLLAIGGAYYLFGRIAIDQTAGGAEFIKIIVGLLAATVAGALLGYGKRAAQIIAPRLTGQFASRLLRAVALSIVVQAPMMVAYTVLAHALSPATPTSQLAAASAIVMFAASVPISLAGWGIREMSAVFVLGAIGVAAGSALLVAVVIGAGSLAIMIVLAAMSVTSWYKPVASKTDDKREAIDYFAFLSWSLPVAAATLVLFQLHLPISSGTLLNVNLADPIVILGGSLFVLQGFQQGRAPEWRLPRLNAAVAAMTAILAFSLILGATRFGYTEWAVINRFLGWFVLLAYAMTGALIVRAGSDRGFQVLLLTFVAATSAVVALEYILVIARSLGIELSPEIIMLNSIQGFAQNRNALAFQVLMAIAATLAVVKRDDLKIGLSAVFLVGLWYAGSRSGWIALAIVLSASLYLKAATFRQIATALGAAVMLALLPVLFSLLIPVLLSLLLPVLLSLLQGTAPLNWPEPTSFIPIILPDTSSTNERLVSLIGGWQMFTDNPVFGAGLGAFRNLEIPSADNIPLVIHSTAIWLMAELGVVGLTIFVVPAVFVLASELKRKHQDEAGRLLVLSLLAFAVMSGPADMLYQRTLWLLLGVGLAMRPNLQTAGIPRAKDGVNMAR